MRTYTHLTVSILKHDCLGEIIILILYILIISLFVDAEDVDSDTDDSLSDTEYPNAKTKCEETSHDSRNLLIEKSLQNPNNTPIGEWERHTRVSTYYSLLQTTKLKVFFTGIMSSNEY